MDTHTCLLVELANFLSGFALDFKFQGRLADGEGMHVSSALREFYRRDRRATAAHRRLRYFGQLSVMRQGISIKSVVRAAARAPDSECGTVSIITNSAPLLRVISMISVNRLA